MLACLLLINCSSSSNINSMGADAIDDVEVQRLMAEALGYLEAHDFENLSFLFHYPSDYDDDEKDKDLCNVQYDLSSMVALFGSPSQMREFDENIDTEFNYKGYGTSSADQYFWKTNGGIEGVFKSTFLSNFTEKDRGTIFITIVNFADKYEIGLLGFGLDSSKVDNKEMSEIMRTLNNRSQSRENTSICSFVG
ncbi:MAG: hypothetical protein COC19_00905 [SAR86 cluster bacterium]|uniref:Uncharacterized protein n=1 Tax=SAR86 cluster bacterium TaxID=2030880 RepID=A0A2A4MTW0_9GAMM|nr:MAG: hypothetical protein COC19_00905 [SAR86 cluster bacterium]